MPQELGAWLHINEAGEVTAFTGQSGDRPERPDFAEPGRGGRAALPAGSVRAGDGRYGSRPLRPGHVRQRNDAPHGRPSCAAAATARELLIDMAAARLAVESRNALRERGQSASRVRAGGRCVRRAGEGSAFQKTVGYDVPSRRRPIGKSRGLPSAKVAGRDIVTGKHRYASDVRLPGMLFGKILRPASLHATSEIGGPERPAQAIHGVTVVHDGSFIGVAAPTGRAGRTGRGGHSRGMELARQSRLRSALIRRSQAIA